MQQQNQFDGEGTEDMKHEKSDSFEIVQPNIERVRFDQQYCDTKILSVDDKIQEFDLINYSKHKNEPKKDTVCSYSKIQKEITFENQNESINKTNGKNESMHINENNPINTNNNTICSLNGDNNQDYKQSHLQQTESINPYLFGSSNNTLNSEANLKNSKFQRETSNNNFVKAKVEQSDHSDQKILLDQENLQTAQKCYNQDQDKNSNLNFEKSNNLNEQLETNLDLNNNSQLFYSIISQQQETQRQNSLLQRSQSEISINDSFRQRQSIHKEYKKPLSSLEKIDIKETIYHEKQILLQCGLHTVNNVLGEQRFTKSDFGRIDKNLNNLCKKKWGIFSNHSLPANLGDYDVNILMMALQEVDMEVKWLSSIKLLTKDEIQKIIDEKSFIGFIINRVGSGYFKKLFYSGRHWFAIKKYHSGIYYLDSKESRPFKQTTDEITNLLVYHLRNNGHILQINSKQH